MKTILKTATTILLSVALMCACSKPDDGKDGAKGDKGDKGDKGEQGATGPQGTPGNAGVTMYTYGSKTFTSSTNYVFPVPLDDVSNSQIYAYSRPQGGNSWYPVPGRYASYFEVDCFYAPNGNLQTGTTIAIISLYKPDGTSYTSPTTWTAFRIVVVPIPASNITPLAATLGAGSKSAALDYSNYQEVAKYYGLPTN